MGLISVRIPLLVGYMGTRLRHKNLHDKPTCIFNDLREKVFLCQEFNNTELLN